MRIGIVGAGRIGGGMARMLAPAGHDVLVSYSRDEGKLRALAEEIGGHVGTPRGAVEFGEVVVLSVPWGGIDEALAAMGQLDGKIVIDTTNQFGPGGVQDLGGQTAAQVNEARMPGARYTKSFNTLTSAFQAEASERSGDARVALFVVGDDADAKAVVAGLIEDAGFVAVDLGGTADAAPMEAPRREGALYGEEYREPEARAATEALRAGEPLPPAPSY
jgi:predicted dinucleotide-binding enzyme